MYRIRTDSPARDQLAALPHDALLSYAEVLGVLKLVPWHGHAHNRNNPEGAVRQFVFGLDTPGLVVYLILDDQLLVDVLDVIWVE